MIVLKQSRAAAPFAEFTGLLSALAVYWVCLCTSKWSVLQFTLPVTVVVVGTATESCMYSVLASGTKSCTSLCVHTLCDYYLSSWIVSALSGQD